VNFDQNPEYSGLGCGFGPITDDGYGVTYIILNERSISFQIASRKSSKKTVTFYFLIERYALFLQC
jgi:hypothetical protein